MTFTFIVLHFNFPIFEQCLKQKNNNYSNFLERFFALAILFLYVFAFFQNNVVHQWHHHEHAHELHSEAQENDPCHLAEYHQGAACGHDTHLNEIENPCDFCQIIVTSQDEVTQDLIQLSINTPEFSLPLGYVWYIKGITPYNYPLRGPPTIA